MAINRRQFLQNSALLSATLASAKMQAATQAAAATGLKDAYKDDFLIGAALSAQIIQAKEPKLDALIRREFNAISPENCMKWGVIRNEDGSWNWKDADAYVDYGHKNKLFTLGHCLVWHSQIQDSVFYGADGKYLAPAALEKKMQGHIATITHRYGKKIQAWDVVNEAMGDDLQLRKSHWFNILGESFLDKAFHFAKESAPHAQLIYNDYNIENTGKREAVAAMLAGLQKRGAPISGVGIQAHISIDGPSLEEIEKSILTYAKLGLRVNFTELDVDVLPSVWNLPVAEVSTRFEYRPERDPYKQGLPKDVSEKLAARYQGLFKLLIKHKDKIDRVTFWGVSDDASWLNDFPINGRTNYPLLFDRNHQPKDAYFRLLDLKR